jgi:drug/metabolite transporter (DMT)-like permease
MGCAVFGLGLLFIIRGQDGNLTADLAALAGAICSGGVMVTIKSLRRTHSSRTIVTWFYGVGAVLLLPFFSRQNVTFTWPLIALILGIGIAGLLAQWIMTDAYKAVPGSVASSMNLLGTPMMMVSGMLFFAETLHMIEMAGAICIMTGLVAIVWPNQSVSKRRQHA